jgi:uncharacterized protein YqgC (DUF456 family)
MDIVGLVVAVMCFVAGLAGTVLPVLPGAPLILLGMVIYGLFTGFAGLSWGFFVGQAAAVALTFLVDYLAGAWAVRRYGGSRAALWGSGAGILFGVLVFGPAGLILGPFLGAFLGELLAGRSTDGEICLRKPSGSWNPLGWQNSPSPSRALHVGVGSLVGLLGGTALKLAVEAAMIAWFFAAVF